MREVTIGVDRIEGEFKTARDGATHFTATRVEPALADKLAAKGVKVSGRASGGVLATLPRMGGGGGLGGLVSAGKSRAKVYLESDTKVTFADVAGVDEAKFELQEIVNFLRDPAIFGRLGARAPKGVHLEGPADVLVLVRTTADPDGSFMNVANFVSSLCTIRVANPGLDRRIGSNPGGKIAI